MKMLLVIMAISAMMGRSSVLAQNETALQMESSATTIDSLEAFHVNVVNAIYGTNVTKRHSSCGQDPTRWTHVITSLGVGIALQVLHMLFSIFSCVVLYRRPRALKFS